MSKIFEFFFNISGIVSDQADKLQSVDDFTNAIRLAKAT